MIQQMQEVGIYPYLQQYEFIPSFAGGYPWYASLRFCWCGLLMNTVLCPIFNESIGYQVRFQRNCVMILASICVPLLQILVLDTYRRKIFHLLHEKDCQP